MNPPTVLNLGGGTDSAGLLVEMIRRGETPDLVIFADVKAEKRRTYEFLDAFEAWLLLRRVALVRVSHTGKYASLEDKCFQRATVPSIAMGWKTCSTTWKRDPIDKYVTSWAPYQDARVAKVKPVKILGYDVDEARRAGVKEDDRWVYRYPLIEWGWTREDCVRAILAAGLPLPGKSACFFCPSSKKPEILALRDEEPDLLARALAMEDRARPNLTAIKGLGRRFSWREFLESEEAKALAACAPKEQLDLFDDTDDLPCGCVD